MFILRAILIACAVILLFCFKVLFFGKKKSVSRPKSNSYPDQIKTEKAVGGSEEKQKKLFAYLDSLKAKEQVKSLPLIYQRQKSEKKEEKEKPCSNLLKPEEHKEEEKKKQKEEKEKPCSDLSKTIPRSYSTTLPGFNNVRRRSSDTYSDLLHTTE